MGGVQSTGKLFLRESYPDHQTQEWKAQVANASITDNATATIRALCMNYRP